MPNWNFVAIAGHAGRAADIRFTPSGAKVASFGLAVNEKFKEQERTHWFDVVAFGKTADIVEERVVKGSGVMVIGKLQTQEWEDKEGKKRKKVGVMAQMVMTDPPKQQADEEQAPF